MSKKNIFSLLLLIIVFGIFFRVYNLSNQPYWMDEGYTINAIISAQENGITKTGASILDSEKNYFCPLYCLPTEKISHFFGNNAFSFRILSAFFGILSVLLIFFVTKLIFKNNKTAILSAFLMSFSYWQIAWSRQARWYTMLLFFSWFSIFFFYKAVYEEKNKILNYFLTAIFLYLSVLTHRLAIILPLVFIFWIIVNNLKNKKIIIASIVFLSTFLVLFSNFILNFAKNIQLNYNLPYYLNFYFRNYFIFVILAIFLYFSAKKSNKKKIVFLAILLLSYLIPLSFFTEIVHYRYIFHLTPIFFILGSAGAIDIYEKIRYNYFKIIFIFAIILAFFILKQGIIVPQNFYFLEADNPEKLNRPYYAYTPQPDFNSAYAVIKENLKPNEIIISSHPHFNKIFLDQAGYWLKYNYLGMEDTPNQIVNNKEYYVGAETINNLAELKNLIANQHGYILFDYMSADGRIDEVIINYIRENFNLIFYDKINSYSQIWVYKF